MVPWTPPAVTLEHRARNKPSASLDVTPKVCVCTYMHIYVCIQQVCVCTCTRVHTCKCMYVFSKILRVLLKTSGKYLEFQFCSVINSFVTLAKILLLLLLLGHTFQLRSYCWLCPQEFFWDIGQWIQVGPCKACTIAPVPQTLLSVKKKKRLDLQKCYIGIMTM